MLKKMHTLLQKGGRRTKMKKAKSDRSLFAFLCIKLRAAKQKNTAACRLPPFFLI
jgi:hypothetical protein